MNLRAAIPGMSLTKEPGNSPWEQPPLHSTPEEALGFYFQKLEDEDILDDILFTLEQGFPLETLVDSMTSVGVMEGYHTVDVKVLVSPIIHEHLRILAETVGIEIVEQAGPSKEARMKEKDKKRIGILLQKALEGPVEITPEVQEEASEALEEAGEGEESMAPTPLIKRRV